MPRPGFVPDALQQQDCPKCRYPMLRAEKLGGVSDQIGVPNLEESWVPPVLYLWPTHLLALVVAGACTALAGLVWGGLARLLGGHALGVWLGGFAVLALELLALWKLRRWAGWKLLGENWKAQMDSGAGRGWFFLWVGLLLMTPRLLIWLIWVDYATSHSSLAMVLLNVLGVLIFGLAGGLGLATLPLVFFGGVNETREARARRRQKLMRELGPGDWVCPNCLHARRGPPA